MPLGVLDTGGDYRPSTADKAATKKVKGWIPMRGPAFFLFHEYGRKFVILQLEMDMKYPIRLELKLL